jgi:metal-sulfur cluster biosynthetic enzyme
MGTKDSAEVKTALLKRLRTVIDPETGADVVRMRLIEDLDVSETGKVRYVFRPSSPVCPLAVSLALKIREAVGEVPGVVEQTITVKGYVQAETLTAQLNAMKEKNP